MIQGKKLLFNYKFLKIFIRVCSKRGNCTENDNCVCNNGYFGLECELTTCFGVPSNDTKY
jgi:hypothetical protein